MLIADGMSPDSWLASSFNTASCDKNPSVIGIFPVKELLPRSKTVSFVKSPISEGMVPRRLRARNSNRVVAWGFQSSPKNLTVGPALRGFGVGRGVMGGTVTGDIVIGEGVTEEVGRGVLGGTVTGDTVIGEGVTEDIGETGEVLVDSGLIVGVPKRGTGPVGVAVGPKIVGGDPKIGDALVSGGDTEGATEGTGEDDGVGCCDPPPQMQQASFPETPLLFDH